METQAHTTFRCPEVLMKRIERLAATERRSLNQQIRVLVEEALEKRKTDAVAEPAKAS